LVILVIAGVAICLLLAWGLVRVLVHILVRLGVLVSRRAERGAEEETVTIDPGCLAIACRSVRLELVDLQPRKLSLRRSDMYRSIMACTACAVLLLAMPALGASLDDIHDCGTSEDIDFGIAACTRVIDDRNEEPLHLRIAYYGRAGRWALKRDFDRAIADYGEVIKLAPADADSYTKRCFWRAIANRDLVLALADCNEALRLTANDSAGALSSRGFVYLRLGRFDDAIADFDRVLKTAQTVPDPLYGRGIAKLHKGDRAGGDADIAAAKLLQADVAKVYEKLGIAPPPATAAPAAK
jgi:tetratricopeptide (TPR) repeat protein